MYTVAHRARGGGVLSKEGEGATKKSNDNLMNNLHVIKCSDRNEDVDGHICGDVQYLKIYRASALPGKKPRSRQIVSVLDLCFSRQICPRASRAACYNSYNPLTYPPCSYRGVLKRISSSLLLHIGLLPLINP